MVFAPTLEFHLAAGDSLTHRFSVGTELLGPIHRFAPANYFSLCEHYAAALRAPTDATDASALAHFTLILLCFAPIRTSATTSRATSRPRCGF
jgi:hypothetical protein